MLTDKKLSILIIKQLEDPIKYMNNIELILFIL